MRESSLNIGNIPPGFPFLESLAYDLLAKTRDDPKVLVDHLILLPTRRACQALHAAFLKVSGQEAVLLPRVKPLGGLDEDWGSEILHGSWLDDKKLGSLFPLSPLRRQALLAQLIQAWHKDLTCDHAFRLAYSLGDFLDRVIIEHGSLEQLEELMPEHFSQHWQEALRFFRLLRDHWPAILEQEGVIDRAAYQDRFLLALAQAWRVQPPEGPIIAAGSTGSRPATAELLAAIASLPKGLVLLPGLDRESDADIWQRITEDPAHPQHIMACFLAKIDVERSEIRDWPLLPPQKDPRLSSVEQGRRRLIVQVMRPAATTEQWRDLQSDPHRIAEGLHGLRMIACPQPREEAAVIALAMRTLLEQSEQTAMLITPDRSLARRVAAALRRWNILVDDSAGIPLAARPPAVFLRLVARFMACPDQQNLLNLLDHPAAMGGFGQVPANREALCCSARLLEVKFLRGVRSKLDLSQIRSLVDMSSDASSGPVRALISSLEEANKSGEALMAAKNARVVDLLDQQISLAEALSNKGYGLWKGKEGIQLAEHISQIRADLGDFEPIVPDSWPDLFDELLTGPVIQPHVDCHPRLAIRGPLEARLQAADLVILGGMNEGIWPRSLDDDLWIARPMLAEIGLNPPERQIGQIAHDLAQALAVPQVLMTRAERIDGVPTVASRWWRRLEAMLEAAGLKLPEDPAEAILCGRSLLAWAEALDAHLESMNDSVQAKLIHEPPVPPLKARPHALSVTDIKGLINDPYGVYVHKILKLRPLEALASKLDTRDFGRIVHRILHQVFLQPGKINHELVEADCLALLEKQDLLSLDKITLLLWHPRLRRIISWIVEQDQSRSFTCFPEIKGEMILELGEAMTAESITARITCRADRIDLDDQGHLIIFDYKTGGLPSCKDVRDNLCEPQLPLEAAIALAGGFPDLPPAVDDRAADDRAVDDRVVIGLGYLRVCGRKQGQEKRMIIEHDEYGARELAEQVCLITKKLLRCYLCDPDQAYKASGCNDLYDQLSRIREASRYIALDPGS